MLKTFKTEIQKEAPNNSEVLQNWFPAQIRSPLFNFQKFKRSEIGTPASSRIHQNLMNDEEFVSLKILKLKYRRGEII